MRMQSYTIADIAYIDDRVIKSLHTLGHVLLCLHQKRISRHHNLTDAAKTYSNMVRQKIFWTDALQCDIGTLVTKTGEISVNFRYDTWSRHLETYSPMEPNISEMMWALRRMIIGIKHHLVFAPTAYTFDN